jgi:thiol-disulfide isomerase/thioredoxin
VRKASEGAVKKNIWILVGLAAAVVVLTFLRSSGPGMSTPLSGPAPSWSMRTLDGQQVMSSEFAGRVVFLNFWATWCPPCRHEIPDFVSFTERHGTNQMVIIGASVDENPETVRSFAQVNGINYPMLMADRIIQAEFGGIGAIPTTFIIDAQGNWVQRHLGAMSRSDLERWAARLGATAGSGR